MRNLVQYPITAEEVAKRCEALAEASNPEGRVGDMDALLLRTAAATVRAADAVLGAIEYRREGPDKLRYVTPWREAADLALALQVGNPGYAAVRADIELLRTRMEKVEKQR